MGIDSGFRVLPESLSSNIALSVCNRRNRKLFYFREKRKTGIIVSDSDNYIVDSMSLKICKLSRSSRKCICQESFETSPDKGY